MKTSWGNYGMAIFSNLPERIRSFVRENPTPIGFLAKKIPQSIKQPIQENLSRLRNVDIASTAAGGALKEYLDTQNLPFYHPRRLVAQSMPAVGAIKNIVAKKPTFFSEQVERAVPGTTGKVAGLVGELLLPGVGGEVKSAKTLKDVFRSTAKSLPMSVAFGASEAETVSQIPQNIAKNIGLSLGISSIAPVVSKINPNAKGFVFGRNRKSPWHVDDVRELDEINYYINTNKNLSEANYDEISERLKYLISGYLPNDIIERVANKYKGNSRKRLLGIINELYKSLNEYEKRKGIVLGFAEDNIKRSTSVQQSPQDILAEAKKGIQLTKGKTKTVGQTLRDLYTDWVDRFFPVERAADIVEKKTKSSLLPGFDPRIKIKQVLGAGGKAELRHRTELDPILQRIDKNEFQDFDVFLKAKRDIGFSLAGRKVFGSDPEKAKSILSALGTKRDLQKYEEVARELYDYQDRSLRKLVDSGFLTEEAYKVIKQKNPNYVPFERVMDEVDNYLGIPTSKLSQAQNPVKKIKGSERAILSPIESIIANTYKIEAAVAKNEAAKSIANLGAILPEIGIKKVSQSGQDTISVWRNGKKEFYEVPQDIAKAVKGLNEEQLGTIEQILSIPATILRQGATGRNPDFMLPNVIRDQFDAAINAKYGYIPFYDYFMGLIELIKHKTGRPSLYTDWVNSGGKIFYEMAGGRKSIAREIEDATKKKSLGKKFFNAIVEGLDVFSEFSETPTRLGVFRRALKKTGNKEIAAYESREATLDFARRGAKIKTLNALVPFFNVGIQGFDRIIRTVKNNPKKMLLVGTIYGIMPQLALTYYNNTFYPEEYKEIPDEVKQDNFVFVRGRNKEGKVEYATLPKGNILPYIANPVDNIFSALAQYDRQSFSSLALSLLGEALPVLEPGKDVQQMVSRSLGSVIPQFAKPAIETVSNYSFYRGRPIVPFFLQNKPPIEQVFEGTETPYKYLGNVFQVSPLIVKNVLEGAFAGYTNMPIRIFSILQKISRGEQPSKNEIPVVRRFFTETYKTGEQFQEEQQKIQEREEKKRAMQEGVPPLKDRLLGQSSVEAAEGKTLQEVLEEQKKDRAAVKDYKDILLGKKKVKDIEQYFQKQHNTTVKDVEREVLRSLPVKTRSPIVLETLKNKTTTGDDLNLLIDNDILTRDVVNYLRATNQITDDQSSSLLSYIKYRQKQTKQPSIKNARAESAGREGQTRKQKVRAQKTVRRAIATPKIALTTPRRKKTKKLTLKDLFQSSKKLTLKDFYKL